MIPSVVEKKDLPKAQMYMSVAYSGTDYVFTAITGFLMTIFSALGLLVLDIFTFILAAISFSKIRYRSKKLDERDKDEIEQAKSRMEEIFGGFRYLKNENMLLIFCIGSSISNFLFGGLNVYMLIIGKEIGGAGYFGLLTAVSSLGIMIGSTILANKLMSKLIVGKIFQYANMLYGIFLVPIAFISDRYILLTVWGLAFLWLGVSQVVQKPIIQGSIPEDKMAKVLSAFSTLSVSALSIGSLFFGVVANYLDWQMFIIVFCTSFVIIGFMYRSNKKLSAFSLK